jgi:hypothetical protein
MSWKKLLQSNKVHRHTTSRQELTEIRRLVARDLADAVIPALSEDRPFATAFNAALQTATWLSLVPDTEFASVPGHHRIIDWNKAGSEAQLTIPRATTAESSTQASR